jgi:hypothetical protein
MNIMSLKRGLNLYGLKIELEMNMFVARIIYEEDLENCVGDASVYQPTAGG